MKRVLFALLSLCVAGASVGDTGESGDLTRYVLAVMGSHQLGSGVAVSEYRVATSCHTLQGASSVMVINRDTTLKAGH